MRSSLRAVSLSLPCIHAPSPNPPQAALKFEFFSHTHTHTRKITEPTSRHARTPVAPAEPARPGSAPCASSVVVWHAPAWPLSPPSCVPRWPPWRAILARPAPVPAWLARHRAPPARLGHAPGALAGEPSPSLSRCGFSPVHAHTRLLFPERGVYSDDHQMVMIMRIIMGNLQSSFRLKHIYLFFKPAAHKYSTQNSLKYINNIVIQTTIT